MTTVTIAKTLGGAPAAYSITHDDGGEGQYSVAVPVLAERNLLGTWHLIGASVNAWYSGTAYAKFHLPHCYDIVERGHEISCHTYNHLTDPQLVGRPEAEVRDQIGLNYQYFSDRGIEINSIAYPGGDNDALVRSVAAEFYEFGRTVETTPAGESLDWGNIDPYVLKVTHAIAYATTAEVDTIIATGKWGIANSHTIAPSATLTPAIYTAHADYIAAKRDAGDLWVAPLKDVAQYIKQRGQTVVDVVDDAAGTMTVTLTYPGSLKHRVPLTLDVIVPNTTLDVAQAFYPMTFSVVAGTTIRFNAWPNAGPIVIHYVYP